MIVDSIIEFPDGLIGLGGSRYALLSTDAKSPFLWLQSLDDDAVALPVTNPHRFFKEFVVELADGDAESFGFDDGVPADVYVTVTAVERRHRHHGQSEGSDPDPRRQGPPGDQPARRRGGEDAAVP